MNLAIKLSCYLPFSFKTTIRFKNDYAQQVSDGLDESGSTFS